MEKKNKVESYLGNPANWIAIVTFLVGLGITRGTFTSKINHLEMQVGELDVYSIKTSLAQIQTDIEWIKLTLKK